MFTSEPSLAQRIGRMIGDTPVVDPRTFLRVNQPQATDLAALIDQHSLRSGLLSAGMDRDDLDLGLPADERVRRSIPFLSKIRNTTAAWCLFRIFRDLYDFDEPQLTLTNYRPLFEKVEATARESQWADHVLRERANFAAVVAPVTDQDPTAWPGYVFYRLETLAPPEAYSDAKLLQETSGGRLDQIVRDYLDERMVGQVRLVVAEFPDQNASSDPASYARDMRIWASALGWHHDRKRTLQILIRGVGQSWVPVMAAAASRYPDARFDLLMRSHSQVHDPVYLARHFANVSVSADIGNNFTPASIEQNFGLRVQAVPMTKVTGFVSDAATVEWSYARLQLARKALALALCKLVEGGYSEEDELRPLLRQVLHDTPRDLYGLRNP